MFFTTSICSVLLAILAFLSCLSVVVTAPVLEKVDIDTLEKRTTHEGRGTWYWPGQGNCGWWNTQSDNIVAIAKSRYDAERAANCGQWMEITNTANGRKVLAQTVDSCESCGYDDIDLSPAAFRSIADLSEGLLRVRWHFENRNFHP